MIAMAVRKIEHVGIMVEQLDRSLRFYTEVVGMEHTYTLDLPNGVRLAFLSFPGAKETEVELIEGNRSEFPQAGKVHHIAFTVDDVEAEFNRIQSLNLPLRDREITTLPNGARYFFMLGPDEELVEFFQPAR
jgi:lactoylglutathione lyase